MHHDLPYGSSAHPGFVAMPTFAPNTLVGNIHYTTSDAQFRAQRVHGQTSSSPRQQKDHGVGTNLSSDPIVAQRQSRGRYSVYSAPE